jgi:hypothetical protein
MVGIIESVEQITVERVDIVQLRESLESGSETVAKGLCGVLDFPGVEGTDS